MNRPLFRWGDLPLYQEQYNNDEAGEGGIAEEVERYTEERDRDWSIKQPRDIPEVGFATSSIYFGRLRASSNTTLRQSLNTQLTVEYKYIHI